MASGGAHLPSTHPDGQTFSVIEPSSLQTLSVDVSLHVFFVQEHCPLGQSYVALGQRPVFSLHMALHVY